LPYARQEAKIVAGILGCEALIGSAATKARVVRELKAGAGAGGVVHLACHGEFNRSEPLRSAVLLAGDDELQAPSRLTGEDIFGLKLEADLVALSGCWTGVSAHRSGEDFWGMTRALMYSGVASVMATLWPVNDLASLFFMKAFYESVCQSEDPEEAYGWKAVALQRAGLEVRSLTVSDVLTQFRSWPLDPPAVKQPPLAVCYPFYSPEFWAPYVLMGDWG